jgi:hypothetical protein
MGYDAGGGGDRAMVAVRRTQGEVAPVFAGGRGGRRWQPRPSGQEWLRAGGGVGERSAQNRSVRERGLRAGAGVWGRWRLQTAGGGECGAGGVGGVHGGDATARGGDQFTQMFSQADEAWDLADSGVCRRRTRRGRGRRPLADLGVEVGLIDGGRRRRRGVAAAQQPGGGGEPGGGGGQRARSAWERLRERRWSGRLASCRTGTALVDLGPRDGAGGGGEGVPGGVAGGTWRRS